MINRKQMFSIRAVTCALLFLSAALIIVVILAKDWQVHRRLAAYLAPGPSLKMHSAHPRNVSVEDLAYGKTQVALMAKDRPELKKLAGPTCPIWDYCARDFAGQFTGRRIAWSANELPDNSDSVSFEPVSPSSRGSGPNITRILHRWCYLLDAPDGAEGENEYLRAIERAMAGELTVDAFAEYSTRIGDEKYREAEQRTASLLNVCNELAYNALIKEYSTYDSDGRAYHRAYYDDAISNT